MYVYIYIYHYMYIIYIYMYMHKLINWQCVGIISISIEVVRPVEGALNTIPIWRLKNAHLFNDFQCLLSSSFAQNMPSLEGQTELVSLSGLVRLHRTTVVQSSVLGHPRSSSVILSSTRSRHHRCIRAVHWGTRRVTRGETPSTASTASADQTSPTSLGPSTPRDFSGYLRIPHDLRIPRQRWYCMAV